MCELAINVGVPSVSFLVLPTPIVAIHIYIVQENREIKQEDVGMACKKECKQGRDGA